MTMSITFNLPGRLVSQLTDLFSPEERDFHVAAALAELVERRVAVAEARLEASLCAELNPDCEPERDAAECMAIIEAGFEDVDTGRNMISLEEAFRRLEETEAELRAKMRGRK